MNAKLSIYFADFDLSLVCGNNLKTIGCIDFQFLNKS